MKFAEMISNQSTSGCWARTWPKCTVRRPTPTPRSGRRKRFMRVLAGPPGRDQVRPLCLAGSELRQTPLQEPLALQELFSFLVSALTGTAQPPLPLHEFFPAQPLSPLLHPPRPLQSFLALQSCLAAVAQPPLPLQEFMPAQVLSAVWQPPWPLQSFLPLHACLADLSSAFFSSARRREPAIIPATTAPMA